MFGASPTLLLTQTLIAQPSVTPDDASCQQIIADRLQPLGFHIESMRFGQTDNLWARRGTEGPCFVFLGHTDVVPPGNIDQWQSDPFVPSVREGYLYGRGSADMKGSIAAMVVAMERFIAQHPDFKGSLGFLLTSDEEGPATDGVVKVIDALMKREENIDWCLVGEPSSLSQVGDILRVGRRGSLNGWLTVKGKQGHVAYPHLAKNPIHLAAPVLAALASIEWDQGNAFFPPTSFQLTGVQSGTGTTNVIPSDLSLCFNFRFSPVSSVESLKDRLENTVKQYLTDYQLHWQLSGLPFLTQKGRLLEKTVAAIEQIQALSPELSTGGGTSDGRFIAPYGIEVLELGPVNRTIHQVNECVAVDDLEKLTAIYQQILNNLFIQVPSTNE
jgi:succinyl-diaminopimelate desuccinylase